MGDQELWALDGVSLEIAGGEFVAIMGASGSGKSTLMNVLGCLDSPTSGDYELEDAAISGCKDVELARIRNRSIGFVFQSFNLLPRMTAVENVELPLLYSQVRAPERRQRALAALGEVGLAERVHHRPNQLSGGQQQRVAIARSIINRPRLLLADEPTGALDSKTSEEIMELFLKLNAEGMTVVLVTHEPDIATYAGRVIRLRDGRILSDERKKSRLPV
ncbi:MAG TPA: macrolide ABC transporter ATP-binding protein [Cyanobacteria bacterium UBA8530]|nr:macrolide ABC transporter ATP-binding protein [Cyanobacteria bacterium UBA8530]